jgi:hypothetical protein
MMILSQYHIFELDTINIYSVGQELRDREDLRMNLLRLEVRMGQQWTGGGPGQPGTGAGRTSGWSCSG